MDEVKVKTCLVHIFSKKVDPIKLVNYLTIIAEETGIANKEDFGQKENMKYTSLGKFILQSFEYINESLIKNERYEYVVKLNLEEV